ncbi:MAG: hypothetical protein JWR71_1682 [Pseudarthrobacter sp.]|nr:hypothetical protein [Pseudarthrobacter sp.]
MLRRFDRPDAWHLPAGRPVVNRHRGLLYSGGRHVPPGTLPAPPEILSLRGLRGVTGHAGITIAGHVTTDVATRPRISAMSVHAAGIRRVRVHAPGIRSLLLRGAW